MPLTGFDHANIRTTQLDAMIDWYSAVLGLRSGPRPDFPFPGAWMYLGSQPVVHLVAVDTPVEASKAASLEHVAFRATGLKAFLAKLGTLGVKTHVARVPGLPIVQVNVYDPEGNHLHIDFDATEA